MAHRVGKKSKKRLKRLQRSIENVKRKGKNKKKTKTDTLNFAAIHFIYDPQGESPLFSVNFGTAHQTLSSVFFP